MIMAASALVVSTTVAAAAVVLVAVVAVAVEVGVAVALEAGREGLTMVPQQWTGRNKTEKRGRGRCVPHCREDRCIAER